MINRLQRVIHAIDCWFFEPRSALALCLYRVLLGLGVLNYAWLLHQHIFDFFGNNGILSGYTMQSIFGGPAFDLIYAFGDKGLFPFFCLFVTAAFLMTIGLWTRWSTLTVLLCLASFNARNPYVMNSGDLLMLLATFVLVFSPSGCRLSVDYVLRKGAGNEEAEIRPVWTMRLLQIQLCLIYFDAFTGKLSGNAWLHGTAVYYVMHLREFAHFPIFHAFDNPAVSVVCTYLCLLTEFCLCTAIWCRRMRLPVFTAGLLMHAGFEWCLNVPNFQWLMVTSYVLFLDAQELVSAWKYVNRRFSLLGSAFRKGEAA